MNEKINTEGSIFFKFNLKTHEIRVSSELSYQIVDKSTHLLIIFQHMQNY